MRGLSFGAVLAGVFGLAVPAAHGALLIDQVPNGSFTVKSAYSIDATNNAADTEAADDFTVPPGQVWTIQQADGFGFAQGNGANTGRVSLYADGGTAPGTQIFSQSNIALGGPSNGTCANAQCDFSAPLSGGPSLKPGTYWVSIQAIQGTPGFGWRQAINPPDFTFGVSAVVRNPGGALYPMCPTYATVLDCGVTTPADGRDLYMRLHGAVIDSRFTLGQVAAAGKNLKLPATFQSAGKATIKGKGIKKSEKSVSGGSTSLKVKLKSGVQKKLARGKNAKVRIDVSFTATGGVATKQSVKVKIVSARLGTFRIASQ